MFLSTISMHSCMIIHYNREQENYCCSCLQAFRAAEKLKYYIKDCFKINDKETIKMPKKGIYIKFKNFRRKSKSPFMIHAGFESILVSEDNAKPNPNEPYTNKYQKRIACSYGY